MNMSGTKFWYNQPPLLVSTARGGSSVHSSRKGRACMPGTGQALLRPHAQSAPVVLACAKSCCGRLPLSVNQADTLHIGTSRNFTKYK